MQSYEDAYGRLPPAVVYGKDGKPLYSWRVLVLPFLEQQAIYRDFHFDEPWDSPHNMQFVTRMPSTFALPGRKRRLAPPGYTVLHVFVGKGTAFDESTGPRLKTLGDRESNTLLIVEAGEPVPWSKPEDLIFVPDGTFPNLCCPFKDGFRAAYADGHVGFIRKETDEGTLRALITGSGNGKLPYSDWD